VTLSIILLAISGWLVGLAINHAADILPTRHSVFQPSHCPTCHTRRPYIQWSAVAAWATRRRRCPHCQALRPTFARSLVVEVVVPALFLFLLSRYGLSLKLGLNLLYTAILVLVTVTDLEHRLIFNIVMLPAIIFAIAAVFFTPGRPGLAGRVVGVFAFILGFLVALAAGGGVGDGDVTLSTFLGFILGFPYIILSLTFGVFLGGFVALLLILTGKVGMKTYIPYGPFLTITGWMMLIWGEQIWKYYFW
jgi:leader peptidase (prepilin peptidase)/N-methyltransferase